MSEPCPHCGTLKVERNGYCATFNFEQRKADKAKPKKATPIKKVSDRRRDLNLVYAQKKEKYMFEHPNCEYHGKDCKGGTLHHKAGRVGFIDEYAELHDIPALIDERYFMNLCQTIHDWATEHSKEAIEQGISISRIVKVTTPTQTI